MFSGVSSMRLREVEHPYPLSSGTTASSVAL